MLYDIRAYFYTQNVLEVETPILCNAIGTDPYIDFFTTTTNNTTLYLQTSPEFSMKRLLAAGSGSIYQVTKAFRRGESGRYHNSEFTLLEWYRLGFNLSDLMDDVENLLIPLLAKSYPSMIAKRISYVEVFKQHTGLNPLVFSLEKYQQVAEKLGFSDVANLCANDHALWLDFLFSQCVQNKLAQNQLCMIYNYPACLPSLARKNNENHLLVERVEVFIDGVEIANGYYELTDAIEQDIRFEQEIMQRKKHNAMPVKKDTQLLAALHSGLSDCSGIAIGLDRLLMLIGKKEKIDEVLAFSISNA
jgi:lysyl-tRNA synthetase class 2